MRYLQEVFHELVWAGLIERVEGGKEACAVYRLTGVQLLNAYCVGGFSQGLTRTQAGNYRKRQRIRVADSSLGAFLAGLRYQWDGAAALTVLYSLPPSERQKKWQGIRYIPTSGDIRCDWRQDGPDKGGRLWTARPNMQGIPRVFRKPGILGIPRRVLYEVDYTAQHLNMARVLAGKKPLEDPWGCLVERTGVDSVRVKEIVNATLSGQAEHEYRYIHDGDGQSMKERAVVLHALGDLDFEGDRWWESTERGLYLMQKGSRIMERICLALARLGIRGVLPLHDGMVVQGRKVVAEKIGEEFERCSRDILGAELPVKIEGL